MKWRMKRHKTYASKARGFRNFSTEKAYHSFSGKVSVPPPLHIAALPTKPDRGQWVAAKASNDFWSGVKPKANSVVLSAHFPEQ
jgi:hypothetical protein